jgi:phosphatidate cytidylyltransferase
MTPEIRDRLFGWWQAFDSRFVLWTAVAVGVLLVTAIVAIAVLRRLGMITPKQYADLGPRCWSWVGLTLVMLAPILLGAAWVIAFVAALSLFCYREFARTTGLFREKAICLVAVLGVFALTFASVDNWSRLYFALAPLTVALIAIVTIPQDRPRGFIQRTALGVLGFLLCGYCLGYLGLMANNPHYRSLLALILLGVEMNDVFAYCTGKLIGGPKVLPNTSPGKTVAGCAGALVLTTLLVAGLGHLVFSENAEFKRLDRWDLLLALGAGMSLLGQFGDLLLSSIKRDVGIKDTGTLIPGHGGLLDRFDSLILVPPAVYHYLSLHLGQLNSAPEQWLTGG